MIFEMADYAWSEHIITVFLACQITIKNVQFQLTVKGKNQRNPKCQNIDELRTAILQEWQQFLQERLRRLVRSMTRRVTELHNKRGGYTRY
jgi:iron-sulfur cluster repair protein YtfE (RIC family)